LTGQTNEHAFETFGSTVFEVLSKAIYESIPPASEEAGKS